MGELSLKVLVIVELSNSNSMSCKISTTGSARHPRTDDPIEAIVAHALDGRNIQYVMDGEESRSPRNRGLDFYLPDCDIHIEVKAFHSDRIAQQLSRTSNCIVIQGKQAALAFAALISQ